MLLEKIRSTLFQLLQHFLQKKTLFPQEPSINFANSATKEFSPVFIRAPRDFQSSGKAFGTKIISISTLAEIQFLGPANFIVAMGRGDVRSFPP
jgi:hypothetical protein